MALGGVNAGTIYANLKLNSSLDRDSKKANTNIKSISANLAKMGIAGGVAVAALSAKFIKMAAAEEAVSRRTASLLKAQGVMWDDVGESLDIYFKKLEAMTAYNDTDLQESFNTLIVSGLTYTEALESMNTVTSMAYSLNRNLNSMALLVGKAYNGQTGELSRYGIVLDQNVDKTQRFSALQSYVNENFADASDRTNSLEGQMDVLKNSMFNIAEAMGVEMMPSLLKNLEELNEWGLAGGWKDISDDMSTIAEGIELITDAIGGFIDVLQIYNAARKIDPLAKNISETKEYLDGVAALASLSERLGFYEPGEPVKKRYFGAGGKEYTKEEFDALGLDDGRGGGVTPSPVGPAIGGVGGTIPAYAGRGRAEREAYGGLTAAEYYATAEPLAPAPGAYTGTPTITAGTPQATATGGSISMLNTINRSIQEGNTIMREVVTATRNISIGGGGGTIGARGNGSTGMGAELPPNVHANMKKTYDLSGLSSLRF